MNKKQIRKTVVRLVTTSCVGAVIDNIVKATTPLTASPLSRIMAQVGGFVLSAMVGDSAADYVETEIESIFDKKEGSA